MNAKLVLRNLAIALGILAAVLGFVFHDSFSPNEVLFANDAPLGNLRNSDNRGFANFQGVWVDLNWIGTEFPSGVPNVSNGLFVLLGSTNYAKFYAPISLLLLGLATWMFLRRQGLHPAACILGGIAASLHSDSFSNACWGLPSRALALMSTMLALTALLSFKRTGRWPYLVLSGFAVGLGISEGYDVGAIFSLYVAAYGVFLLWRDPVSGKKKPIRAALCVGLMAIFAAIFATQSLYTLIGTQLTGVANLKPTTAKLSEEEKETNWTEATNWSLPKVETLRVIIPGLFGYRMDTPEGGNYWGMVGHRPDLMRHSGSGEYAGVLVVLVALFAVAQAARGKQSPLSRETRSEVWFWSGVAFVSLLFAFGRNAPFYTLVYHLPFFSTIRIPLKFMHPFECAILVLFGFGLNTLFLESKKRFSPAFKTNLQAWWKAAPAFYRKWGIGCGGALAAGLVGALVFASSRRELTSYLGTTGFNEQQAQQILNFSMGEIGWFILFLALSGGIMILFLSGWFNGSRIRLGIALLGAVLVADLLRADRPWVIYLDYKEVYESNPVIDFLKERPYEHRATAKLSPFSTQYLAQAQFFGVLCNDWLQHLFQFYAIQSLDVIQMPRMPEVDKSYLTALLPKNDADLRGYSRLWELSNTRYILAQKDFLEWISPRIDPEKKRFTLRESFEVVPKSRANPQAIRGPEDLTAELKPDGHFGIFEFAGALPRVKLYSNWKVETNDTAVLNQLSSASFDPGSSVLVSTPSVPTPSTKSGTNSGSVTITKYEPKTFAMDANCAGPSVLLLNDKFSPGWVVRVDGKEQPLLRCNYIMRGVYLEGGSHRVEFHFEPPTNGLYVSLAAALVGIGLCGYLAVTSSKSKESDRVAPGKLSS